jgi:hypothetical protein
MTEQKTMQTQETKRQKDTHKNNKHILSQVGSISKTQTYLQPLNTVFLVPLLCETYIRNSAVGMKKV